ncbi:MAG: hypothetical protein Q8T08_11530, partial [Ignavibacteria bacterium]|nr:hypothetical protein [Ignavibacteria bacterium]
MTTKKKEIKIPVFDDRDLYDIFPKKRMMDGEEILRERGYLYFIGKDGYVWAAPMKHNKTGKKKKVGTEK